MKKIVTMALIGVGLASIAWSKGVDHTHPTPYSGLQNRDIKSLSEDDIADIENGRGWGLALPAELNGLPGPLHVLELESALELSPAQRDRIRHIYDSMKGEAIEVGERFIEAERAISDAFSNPNLSAEELASLLRQAEELRSELRYIHLSRHLMTPDILTEPQIQRYAELRGYVDEDLCASIPEGHDARKWRAHNGCE